MSQSESRYLRFRVNLHSIASYSYSHIGSLSRSNGIKTHFYLVSKRTLNYLAKLVSLAK